jgi:hypothetical protein
MPDRPATTLSRPFASIAPLDRAVARVVIEIHSEILARMIVAVWRFPDIVICGCHWMKDLQ